MAHTHTVMHIVVLFREIQRKVMFIVIEDKIRAANS